jgi:hypothetical protein
MPPPARGYSGHRRLGKSGGAKTEALKSYGFHAADRRRCPGRHEERMDSDHELRRAWFPHELVPLTERLWPGKQVIGESEGLSSTRQAEHRAQAYSPRRGDIMSCLPVRPNPLFLRHRPTRLPHLPNGGGKPRVDRTRHLSALSTSSSNQGGPG